MTLAQDPAVAESDEFFADVDLPRVDDPTSDWDYSYARIIADSISPDGVRITSWEKRHHRWVLAEDNTHATAGKNSASMRAIPIGKVIDAVRANPAVPLVWASEQKGMSGGEPVSVENQAVARRKWDLHREATIKLGFELRDLGVHKSITNRLLEPHSMHVSVWTATAIENYFAQRCHADAQPEIRAVAEKMRKAYEASTPVPLAHGEWHLPYIKAADRREVAMAHATKHAADPLAVLVHEMGVQMVLARISAARVARTSYLTQNGVRDLVEDLSLYNRLVDDRLVEDEPPHWSPLEQVATPCPENRQAESLVLPNGFVYETGHLPKVGKYLGWISLRHLVEAENRMVTFR